MVNDLERIGDHAVNIAEIAERKIDQKITFSDIAGRHFIRLRNSSKSRQELAERLKLAGCDVDLSGTDWHDAGSFPSR